MGLRQGSQQGQVRPVNGKAEANDSKAREDSDEYGEDEKKQFFVENTFESGK